MTPAPEDHRREPQHGAEAGVARIILLTADGLGTMEIMATTDKTTLPQSPTRNSW